MYHCVYKTTNLVNGKYYYGAHSTNNLHDGYLGSGKYLCRAIKKNGKKKFKKEIVAVFDRSELMYEFEALVIDLVRGRPDCYNIIEGGTGYTSEQHKALWTPKRREEQKVRGKLRMEEMNKVKWSDPEYIQYQSEIQKKIAANASPKIKQLRKDHAHSLWDNPDWVKKKCKQQKDRMIGSRHMIHPDGRYTVVMKYDIQKYEDEGYLFGRPKKQL